jgi:L-aminopeptidase/D-esterase-like protein
MSQGSASDMRRSPSIAPITVIVADTLGSMFRRPMAAGTAVLNGAGELTGSLTIREWGTLETPVVLTATMSVGVAYQGVIEAMLSAVPEIADDVVAPVVGECDDSWLSNPAVMAVQPHHVSEALADATDGLFAAGAIGAGSGMTVSVKGSTARHRASSTAMYSGAEATSFGARTVVPHVASRVRFAALGRNGEREAPEALHR